VVVVDLDPQGHLTDAVGLGDLYLDAGPSLYDALLDPARADDFSRPGQAAALIDAHGLAAEYRQHPERLIARYPFADMSRLDYTVLRDLAKRHPRASAHDLGQALREGSPNVHERKTNDRWLDRCVEKTVTAVNLDPHMREARHEHERQRGGGRGR